MDAIFIIEMGIVLIIVVLQFLIFYRNEKEIRNLTDIFPKVKWLQTFLHVPTENQRPSGVGKTKINLIEDDTRFSEVFRKIITVTNAYLIKNHGITELDHLKDISFQEAVSHEKAIESNITLPLYIGLLCTFVGVIIGLIKIAIVGVNDAAIQSFIGGVLIGMIGSASGLALTVRSNYLFKNAKRERDVNQYDYLNFLRSEILPAAEKDAEAPLASMRKNLAIFNEGFAQYQQYMNESLGDTLRLFNELKDVYKQVRVIQEGFHGMSDSIRYNDDLLVKQVDYLDGYAKRAEELTKKLNHHFILADKQLESLVAENIKTLHQSTQSAYVKVDKFMAVHHHGHTNGYTHGNGASILQDFEIMQKGDHEIQTKLLDKLTLDAVSHDMLNDQVKQMNVRLAEVVDTQSGSFMNSKEFKFFVYAGVAAFVVSIVSGILRMFLAQSPLTFSKNLTMKNESGKLFWVSFADLMTALFIIALALFVLSYKLFKNNESDLLNAKHELELRHANLEQQNADLEKLRVKSMEFDKQSRNLAKLKVQLNEEQSLGATLIQQLQDERAYLFDLQKKLKYEQTRLAVMEEEYLKLREIQKAIEQLDPRYFVYQPQFKRHVVKPQVLFPKGSKEIPETYHIMLKEAGKALQKMTHKLDPDDNIKYLLIIEGMASKDDYEKNYELSYDRALALYQLWEREGISFDSDRFEVIISGSGERGVGRDMRNESNNQRFLVQVSPKIGELRGITYADVGSSGRLQR